MPPIEKYSLYRKRLMIYVEGELIIGLHPGLVAREVILNLQGKAHFEVCQKKGYQAIGKLKGVLG